MNDEVAIVNVEINYLRVHVIQHERADGHPVAEHDVNCTKVFTIITYNENECIWRHSF